MRGTHVSMSTQEPKLGTCWKCRFSGSTPKQLNQKPQGAAPAICLTVFPVESCAWCSWEPQMSNFFHRTFLLEIHFAHLHWCFMVLESSLFEVLDEDLAYLLALGVWQTAAQFSLNNPVGSTGPCFGLGWAPCASVGSCWPAGDWMVREALTVVPCLGRPWCPCLPAASCSGWFTDLLGIRQGHDLRAHPAPICYFLDHSKTQVAESGDKSTSSFEEMQSPTERRENTGRG